jgi:hypothetical protein
VGISEIPTTCVLSVCKSKGSRDREPAHRLLIQPSYSIEDIHLALIDQSNEIALLVAKTGDFTIPDEDASASCSNHGEETGVMSMALVSQNGLGLKNTLAVDADVETHALL